MIFFTSDTHFCHDKMAQRRGFASAEEMNWHIVNTWNMQVLETDTVFHLGDICMGKTKDSINILQKLNGRKYLVPRNHDHSKRINIYSEFFEILPPIHRLKSKFIKQELWRDVACGAFLCHYPMIDWGKPIWHLHGHFHGDKLHYVPKGAIFDVSFDKIMKLWSYDELEATIPECYESERYNH